MDIIYINSILAAKLTLIQEPVKIKTSGLTTNLDRTFNLAFGLLNRLK